MTQNFLNTTTHNVAWIHKRYIQDEITLEAPFQRNPVWTTKQKAYLIDTILRGYPIPELYVQEYTDAEGNDVYVVVDGQQRIRACVEYVAGAFALDRQDSPEWAEMKFDDLNETHKKRIYGYNFVVRTLPEMDHQQLREMFQRLNRNTISLNSQELRHATYWGEFISCVEGMAEDTRWTDLGIFTPNDVRRMLDIEYISELVVGYLHGIQNKKESLDSYYELYEQEFEERRRVETQFNIVLGEIQSTLPELHSTRWRKKSDFYTLFLVMADQGAGLPFAREVRDCLREELLAFGGRVDRFLRTPEEDPGQDIRVYSTAVERAASDLASRRRRAEVVRAIVAACVTRGA